MALDETRVSAAEALPKLSGKDPLVGAVVGDRYQITALVGQGNMGSLYKATHVGIGRQVAVKVLHEKLAHEEHQLKRFHQEARAAGTLSHANVCPVCDAGELPDGRPYLVMDYIDGVPLSRIIQQTGGVPAERAVQLFLQICEGLKHAHHKGLIHRDLKPSNIMVCSCEQGQDVAKIVDFGIAKQTNVEQPQHLTQTGEVFGSPLYMSPEQAQGFPLDQRSDIYSLGCLMYETLSGVPPLRGENAVQTIVKHISEMPRPMSEVVPNKRIDPQFEKVVMTALQKDPEKRFPDVQALEDQLKLVKLRLVPCELTAAAAPPAVANAAPAKRIPWVRYALIAVAIASVGKVAFKSSDQHPANPAMLPATMSHNNWYGNSDTSTSSVPLPTSLHSVVAGGDVHVNIHVGDKQPHALVPGGAGMIEVSDDSVTLSGSSRALNEAIDVYVSDLSRLDIGGLAVVAVDGTTHTDTSIDVGGSTKLTMTGSAQAVDLDAGGDARVNLLGLKCASVKIDDAGSAEVRVNGPSVRKLAAGGSARVLYKGALTISPDIGGSASVSPIK